MKSQYLLARTVGALGLAPLLSACAIMSASGPSSRNISNTAKQANNATIKVVDVTAQVTRQILSADHKVLFSQNLGDGHPIGTTIGRGDVLDIAIWEAPPAALFGAVGGDSRLPSSVSLMASASIARATNLPEQMVDSDGRIFVPFVGSIQAAGRTPQAISREISSRLAGIAHEPQAIVRLIRNAAATVTVVGDVVNSTRLPLTAKGERVLDALAGAGGTRQPVNKVTIRITRGQQIAAMPLEAVVRDPRQNVILQPDDVMTVLFQPYSFTALGATGKNEEISFEATGFTLAQALGRVNGLQDSRADVKGVFLFRLEDPSALTPETLANARLTPEGKVPVIYRVNMKDPATFFIAQNFPIRDKDVLYVSNAPLADFQKFISVVFSTLLPVATVAVAAP